MKRLLPLLLCLFLLAACTPGGADAPPQESGVTPVPNRPQTSPSPSVTETAEPVRLVWSSQTVSETFTASDGTVLLTAEFFLPAIENPTGYAAFAAINDFYATEGDLLLGDAREQALWAADEYAVAAVSGFPFDPYVMSQSFTVTLESDALVSLTRTGLLGGGGMPEQQRLYAEQFSLTDGRQLHFADLCDGIAADARARVEALLREAAQTAEPPLDAELIVRRFVPDRFYLTADAFVVFFNPGDLSPDDAAPLLLPLSAEGLRGALKAW